MTGGAGFIGTHLTKHLLDAGHSVLNIDNLTYAAGDPHQHGRNQNYRFVEADINELRLVIGLLDEFCPDRIIHLAAETHVDRSIQDSVPFIHSNVMGTQRLLEATRRFLEHHDIAEFRLIHFSTDEVFGSLGDDDAPIGTESPYQPSSPYAASKAAADHLVHAWNVTFGIPTQLVRSTNVFGPGQHQEKLIPTILTNAIHGRPIPIYGSGENRRDWLYVADCVEILTKISVVSLSASGSSKSPTFNLSGGWEVTNNRIASLVCQFLETQFPADENPSLAANQTYHELVELTSDRPGHDFRYALDDSTTRNEFSWAPHRSNEQGLQETVAQFVKSHLDKTEQVEL